MFKKKVSFGLTLMLIVFVLVGCGGGGDIPPTTTSTTPSTTTSSTTTTSTTTIPSSTTSSTTTTSTTTTTISGYTVSGKFYLNDVLNSSDNDTQITIRGLTGSLTKIATVSAGNFSFSAIPNGSYHLFFGTNLIPIGSNYLFITAEVSGANVSNAHFYLYNVFTTIEAFGSGLGGVTLESYLPVESGSGWLNSSEASGLLSFVGLKNRSYTFRPIKTGCTFSPATRETGVLTASKYIPVFTATGVYSISGKACFHSTEVVDGVKSPTVRLFSGGTLLSVTTPETGDYTFSNLVPGNYSIQAMKAGWEFTSREVVVTNATRESQNIAGNPTSWEVLRMPEADKVFRSIAVVSFEGTHYYHAVGGTENSSSFIYRKPVEGGSWSELTSPTNEALVWITTIVDDSTCFLTNRRTFMWLSNDNGQTWSVFDPSTMALDTLTNPLSNEVVTSLCVGNDGKAWLLATEGGALKRTTDEGETWTTEGLSGVNYVSGDNNKALIAGNSRLYRFTDSFTEESFTSTNLSSSVPDKSYTAASGRICDSGNPATVIAANDGSILKAPSYDSAIGDWIILEGLPYNVVGVRAPNSYASENPYEGFLVVGEGGLIMRHR